MREVALAAVAAVLAVVLGAAAWVSWQNGRLKDELDHAHARVAVHQQALLDWQKDSQQARDELAVCLAQWADAEQDAAAQLQASEAALAAAKEDAARWRQRWDARPTGCRAALAALDSACPDLSTY